MAMLEEKHENSNFNIHFDTAKYSVKIGENLLILKRSTFSCPGNSTIHR